MKSIFALIGALLLSLSMLGADAEPYLKSAQMPFYPPLCRQARIEGTVSMHFTVNEQGDTSDVQAVTGNKMLQDAAIKNIQDWKFWPSRCACRVKRDAVFVYRLSRRGGIGGQTKRSSQVVRKNGGDPCRNRGGSCSMATVT